jgi:hypothetical protein
VLFSLHLRSTENDRPYLSALMLCVLQNLVVDRRVQFAKTVLADAVFVYIFIASYLLRFWMWRYQERYRSTCLVEHDVRTYYYCVADNFTIVNLYLYSTLPQ